MADRSHVTTHVLDAANGSPAQGISVDLVGLDGVTIASSTTDAQGRASTLGPSALPLGVYRLSFHTGDYFAAQGASTFYPRVDITFEITAAEQHYHVPILLSPFAFTTYRGS